MPRTTFSVEFGQGLDTKTDSKVAAKPTSLTDCIFTKLKRLSKRNGHDAMTLNVANSLGTISSPKMAAGYRNELLIAGSASNGPRLLSYSSNQNLWIDRGKYISIGVSKEIVSAPELNWINNAVPAATIGVTNSSGCYLSGVSAYAYDGPTVSGTGAPAQVFYSLIDNTTGTRLVNQSAIGTDTLVDGIVVSAFGTTQGYSKIVVLGSSRFAIFYISRSGGGVNKLCYQTVTVVSGIATLGAEVQLNVVTTGNSAGDFVYDVINTSTGAFVALGNGSNVVLYTLSTSGAIAHGPSAIGTAGPVGCITIQLDPTGANAWVYWLDNLTKIRGAIYSSSALGTAVLAATDVATGLSDVRQMSAWAQTNTSQFIFWSVLTAPNSGTNGVYYPKIYVNALNQIGSIGLPTLFLSGLDLYSKPFTVSSRSYLACMNLSQSNPVGVVIDLLDGLVVSKFLPGSAEGYYSQGFNSSAGTYMAPSLAVGAFGYLVRHPGFVTVPFYLSSTRPAMACGFAVSALSDAETPTANLGVTPAEILNSVQMGVCSVAFDFNHKDSYQGIIQENALVLNGGIVYQYDGSYVSELGFTVDPDQVTIAGDTSSGHLVVGKYVYYVVYEWVDALGNLHQSAPSIGVTVKFTSGSTNGVTLYVPPCTATQKKSITVRIYRTIADGTQAYLVGTQDNGFLIGGLIVFADIYSQDDVIVGGPTLYTEGGSILPNVAPPSALIMWTANNRLSVVDSEDPATKIEYSKTASEGTGISFSSGILEYIVDSYGGAISGAIRLDEKQIILKKSAIGFFIGDGADDSGNGSTLTPIQFIPADTGCISSKSVISYPAGILFKSPKGIYQLNRGMQITYFGTEVEQYNAQDISSAVLVYDKNQIRFLTSSGTNLTYDYVMGQWSAFSNPAGVSASIFNNLYVYAASDGRIFQENTTSFLDDSVGYAPDIYLQWIKASSIQGFQRCRAIEMLGDFLVKNNGHGVQISTAWDFDSSNFSAPVVYSFSDKDTNGFYQYRQHLTRQKGDAFQLRIKEIITNASGEYIDFTDLSLEITPKVGMNKVSGSKSVG